MKIKEKKIIIFAAGTGGHIYPGISIAKELIKNNIKILWIGTAKGMENKILSDININIKHIDFFGIRGKGILPIIKLPFRLIKATIQAFIIIKKYNPNLALSMGGYISFPCCIASYILRKPIFIHEQNIIFGLANNILKILSKKIILGMPLKKNSDKYKFLGNPIRYEKIVAEREFNEKRKINLLVIGGSLGAKVFNEIIPRAIYLLNKTLDCEINIIHQAGKTYTTAETQYNNIDVEFEVKKYINSMKDAYEWCDIIICRGGAITISELMIFGVPAVIVPYPYATDDHQMKNCRYLESKEAAIVIDQKNLTDVYLAKILKSLIENSKIRKTLSENILNLKKKDATENICNLILDEIN
ncbi:MAG: undecaprenyldiphospho-muramoylpentapeptide beta-N-acetylglucosaminyltransferase [Gammaproteobacteria bacterium]|nr:undecaprenyldiphospho-muramoylpentapeptide beta-N-acetylglucosaminyltransferase [Gammaproteobacteria bacterium]